MSVTRCPIRSLSTCAFAIFASMLPAACQPANPTPSAQSTPSPTSLPRTRPRTPTTITPSTPQPPTLSGKDANAIVRAATQAQYQTRTLPPDTWDHITIPQQLWPPALADLHPLRIWQHHGNLVIVLSASAQGQDGWYVKPGISSYFPTDNAEAFFEPMTAPNDSQIEDLLAPFKPDSQLHPSTLRSESNGKTIITASALYHFHTPNPSWGPPTPKPPPK